MPRWSPSWLGTHQRINKAAASALHSYRPATQLPDAKAINRFEGIHGPDGLKIKSAGKDEPLHFYFPHSGEGPVLEDLNNHMSMLTKALSEQDEIRSAFEAAWLAHALVDGLTPAHQYPFEAHKVGLRGREESNGLKHWNEKVWLRTGDVRQSAARNLLLWGPKGLLSTHQGFELGVATVAVTHRIKVDLRPKELTYIKRKGPEAYFRKQADEVADMRLYRQFYEKGWSSKLARRCKHDLLPLITRSVATTWWYADTQGGK